MRTLTKLRNFLRQERGTATIEFAFVAPLLITTYLGFSHMASQDNMHSKVSDTGATINDIIAKLPQITGAELDATMNAGLAVAGNWGTQIKVRVVGVEVDVDGNTNVVWSRAKNTSAPAVDSSYTLPPSLLVREGFIVATTTMFTHKWDVSGTKTGGNNEFRYEYFHVPRSSFVTDCTDC